jgi:hypothetical protein
MFIRFIATIRLADGAIVTRGFVTRTKIARARADALVGPGEELVSLRANEVYPDPEAPLVQMDWEALARANAETAS